MSVTFHSLLDLLKGLVAKRAGLDCDAIEVDKPPTYYGFDSLAAAEATEDLEARLGVTIDAALLYDTPSILDAARRLHRLQPQSAQETAKLPADVKDRRALLLETLKQQSGKGPHSLASTSRDRDLVAAIGIGCRFPGNASDPRRYWDLLAAGSDAISEVPSSRWDIDAYYDVEPNAPGKMITRWGGFVDDPGKFDAQAFGISPREAAEMDPEQRLLLEVAFEAIEDAGIPLSTLRGSSTGVFVGIANEEYSRLGGAGVSGINAYTGTGIAHSVASGRISYLLGTHGPSISVDTACSSSLVAVHLAVQSLLSGEIDLAIVGGVNLMLSPEATIFFSQVGVMSRGGRCRSYDAAADGYVRAEGCGVVVLKRLSDAHRDRDSVYGVIAGSAVNHDGASGGLTVPSSAAQQKVIRRALEVAGVSPRQVAFIEGHGSGTSLGDAIELGALHKVFADVTRREPLLVGSCKTNVGHAEAAAGIASLIKALLAVQHCSLPPNVHYRAPNPNVELASIPARVPTELSVLGGERLFGGVSSFGISGTNAHIIVGAPPAVADAERHAHEVRETNRRRYHLLPVSARSPQALQALVGAYRELLASAADAELSAICASAARDRDHHPKRFAVVGDDRAAMIAEIDQALKATSSLVETIGGHKPPRLIFVFSGQGGQWAQMGRGLLESSAAFRERFIECDQAIAQVSDWSPLSLLAEGDGAWLERIDRVQPMLFAYQVALAAHWIGWGLEPSGVIGQSMGEVAAAVVAGGLSLVDGATVICRRSELMSGLSGKGAMLVTELSAEQADGLIANRRDRVSIAVSGSPRSTVLSGDAATIDELLSELNGRDVFCRKVEVDVASHSPQMDPIREDLNAALSGLSPLKPKLPMWSTVTAERVQDVELVAHYWMRNLRDPVLLHRVVTSLLSSEGTVFLELSPHPVLVPVLEQNIAASSFQGAVVAPARRDEDDEQSVHAALARLYSLRLPVRWDALYPARQRANLPRYPWVREHHWKQIDAIGAGVARPVVHPLLGQHVAPAGIDSVHVFEGELSARVQTYLAEHVVAGANLVPGAAFLEMALAAARIIGMGGDAIDDVRLLEPLILRDDSASTVQCVVRRLESGRWRFRISSRVASTQSEPSVDWLLHCEGVLGGDPVAAIPESVQRPLGTEALDRDAFYSALSRHGLKYGAAFQVLGGIEAGTGQASASVALKSSHVRLARDYVIFPTLVDGALQLLGAALHQEASNGGAPFVPARIGRLRLLGDTASIARAHAHVRAFDADEVRADLMLTNDADQLVAWIGDVVARRVQDERATSIWENGLLHTVWRDAPLAAEPAAIAGHWLVVSSCEATGRAFAAALREHGAKCTLALEGRRLVVRDPGKVELDFQRSDEWTQLFEHCRREDELTGVVHLGAAASAENLDTETTASSVRAHCGSLLSLVQGLVVTRFAANKKPTLLIATFGALDVPGTSARVTPAQAPAVGLGRTLLNEMSELGVVLVDLQSDATGTWVADLLRELPQPSLREQISWRDGMRRVARLRRRPLQVDATPAPLAVSSNGVDGYRLRLGCKGLLDSFALIEEPYKVPGANELRIRVKAAGLNFSDVMKAMGVYPEDVGTTMAIGAECVGEVVEVGSEVTGFAPGDRVIAVAPDCFASTVNVAASQLWACPERLSDSQAATLPIAFLTSYYCLKHLARVKPGERVLIHSATGAVGLAAIQIARLRGADVLATAGSDARRRHLRAMGVQHVLDSRSTRFAADVLAATAGQGVDVVLNCLAGELAWAGLSVLRPFGRFLEIGKADIYGEQSMPLSCFKRNLSYLAVDVDRACREDAVLMRKLLDEILQLVGEGKLDPVEHTCWPLSRAADAFRTMAMARHLGKCVLTVESQCEVARNLELAASSPKDAYVITGGAGALGLICADWLVSQGVKRLVLVSRRGEDELPPETRQRIARLRAALAEVSVSAHDVADLGALTALFEGLAKKSIRVRGIVHSAGVLCDALVMNQRWDDFEAVMQTKVRGAWNLHQLSLRYPVDHFVTFSSVAGMMGSPGQSNYAAANCFLDTLAAQRTRLGLASTNIAWGPWADEGLAARAEQAGRVMLDGFHRITPFDGQQALTWAIGNLRGSAAVLPIASDNWRDAYPGAVDLPIFAELLDSAAGATLDAADCRLRRELLALQHAAAREKALHDHLRETIGQVLRIPVEQVDVRTPLNAMGLDSLMALELRNRLEVTTTVRLSATIAWSYPTIIEMAPFLASKMGVPLDPTARKDEPQRAAIGEEDRQALNQLFSFVEDDVGKGAHCSHRVELEDGLYGE